MGRRVATMKARTPDLEDVLWTLHKGDRAAEARIGTAGMAGGQPELRLYTTREAKGKFAMVYSQIMKDTRTARSVALEKKAEFEAQGWTADDGRGRT